MRPARPPGPGGRRWCRRHAGSRRRRRRPGRSSRRPPSTSRASARGRRACRPRGAAGTAVRSPRRRSRCPRSGAHRSGTPCTAARHLREAARSFPFSAPPRPYRTPTAAVRLRLVIELHAHSTASDGVLDPAQLVARAVAVGVTTLALTDHDTLDGCPAAIEAGRRVGVEAVPGIELSVRVPRGTFHLLGYFGEPAPPVLVARMAEIAETRERRNAAIMMRLAQLGVPVDPDLVRAAATGRVGRPHIAAALVAAGHCEDYVEAFDRYLGDGAAAYVPAGAIDPVESVQLGKAAGGAAAPAPPATLLLGPHDPGAPPRRPAGGRVAPGGGPPRGTPAA